MFNKKIKLSIVLAVLTNNAYCELLNLEQDQSLNQTITAMPVEIIDVSHSIIQNLSTSKQKKQSQKGKSPMKVDFSSLIIMDSEKSSANTNGLAQNSSAFKLSYDKELTNDSDIGAIFSYRDTEKISKSILIAPYYKYYTTLNKYIDLETIANLTLNKEKVNIGQDYNNYGGGITLVPTYYLNDNFIFSLPIGIQAFKKGSTSNNTKTQKLANYGIGTEYRPLSNLSINAHVLQTKDLDSNSNLKANYYILQSTYYSELWNVGLGYKTVKNIANYEEDTYMVTVQYNW